MSGVTIVVIDESTSKVVTGTYEFNRDDGGTLLVPSGAVLPSSPQAKEMFWLTTDSKLYRRNDGNTAWEAATAVVTMHAIGGSDHSASTLAALNTKVSDATLDDVGDPRDPNAHAGSHQNGGSDEISVAGLNGVLADRQDADKLQGRNVVSTAPTSNQVLEWNGSAWGPADLSVFGSEFQQAADDSQSQTTSTAWQQKLKMTTSVLPAGTYRIGWSYEWRYSLASHDFRGRVQVDDTTTLAEQRQEPKDPGSNQSYPASGFGYLALAAGTHEIDIDYCAGYSGNTASIKRARLEIWRIS